MVFFQEQIKYESQTFFMNQFKYILTCSGKFWYFDIGRVLHQRNKLEKIICGYPWFKLKNEKVPKKFVESHGIFNILRYPLYYNPNLKKLSDYLGVLNKKKIDRITCNFIDHNNDADVLLALAGVALNAGKKMVKNNKIFICERASSHIVYQNNILLEEYKECKIKKEYVTHKWFIDNELKEYEEADIILVPSNFVKKTFDKSTLHKVKVLEFGSNNEYFFPNINIKKSQKYFDILFIGAKSLRKGLHYLIDAFHKFEHPNKRLHVVGSDTNDKEFFINKLKHDKIIVYGHIPKIKLNDILNKCHVFVLPSIEEGLAQVTLQAVSSGCPIIVSENTGAADYVLKHKCGFVVPIRNSNAITDNLQLLADDKDLLSEFSLSGINASKRHTWSDYVDKLEDLILEFKTNKL